MAISSAGAAAWHPPKQELVSKLPFTELEPILAHLLNSPPSLSRTLAAQCAAAISELDEDSRPDTFEGLLDVARFCVEDDPGWSATERQQLAVSHPRIGAPTASLTGSSAKEQAAGGDADPTTLKRLDRLNDLYERKFPNQVFTTFVNGRSRAAVADELEAHLRPQVAAADPDNFPKDLVVPEESSEWETELERNTEALWAIAYARAPQLAEEAKKPPPNLASSSPPKASPAASTEPKETTSQADGKEEPFISLASFRMLALSSPVLESFFETDLKSSFSLIPPERSESGGAYAWHAAPVSDRAPRATPGAQAKRSALAASSYSKDVTTGARGRVVGFLGGLLGEEGKAKMDQLADSVGQRLSTHTVSGPVPSFGRNTTLDGTAMDQAALKAAEDERRRQAADERKSTFSSRLAGVVRSTTGAAGDMYASFSGGNGKAPSPPPKPAQAPALPARGSSDDRQGQPSEQRPTSLRVDDIAELGPGVAAEALRAAAAQERSHFIIDEVADVTAEADEADADADVDADAGGLDDEMADEETREPASEQGRLEGQAAKLAQDLRSAPAQ